MAIQKVFPVVLLLCSAALLSMKVTKNPQQDALQGAWQFSYGNSDYSVLMEDGYCMLAQYNPKEKKFTNTYGGPYRLEGDKLKITIQFNSSNKAEVGNTQEHSYKILGDELIINSDGYESKWKRVDAGNKNLAGNWRITQRKQGDKMVNIQLGARRTLKLLTSTRFQWAAVNIETGEFFGTGGGTYTFNEGKYTENLEFFSRDSSRVGMSLTFDGQIENGRWIHSGKSSKGDPVYEIWERLKD